MHFTGYTGSKGPSLDRVAPLFIETLHVRDMLPEFHTD